MSSRIKTQGTEGAPRLNNREGLAYAAGLFDGEGCIHISKQAKTTARRGYIYRLVATVAQNHLSTLIDFQALTGVEGRIYQRSRSGTSNRDSYALNYDGGQAEELIQRLLPLLLRKKDEAKEALKFQDEGEINTHFGPNGCPDNIWKVRDACYRKLRKLK